MLENWLAPISLDKICTPSQLHTYQWGKCTQIYDNNFPDLKKTQVAIIGFDPNVSDQVRKALFQLSYPFTNIEFVDVGNTKKPSNTFLLPVIKELISSGIFPIVLGNQTMGAAGQFQAYLDWKKDINLVCVERLLDHFHSHTCFSHILENYRNDIFNLMVLGAQMPFCNPATIKYFDKQNFEIHRLGKIRSNIAHAEPFIRDADLVTINADAIRAAACPTSNHPQPSGLTLEEICQIARYLGLSSKVTSLGIFGFSQNGLIDDLTAQTIAQTIFYFMEGFSMRKNEFPNSLNELTQYLVEIKHLEKHLSFWKSERTGRWWIEAPQDNISKSLLRHKLIPCSYEEYQMACELNLSDRILLAFDRFDK